nr:hypothetical protein [Tanacetum cinerariifolium]
MGDEHLNTIPATKLNKFIKSCVENLVPNPSESEGENECDVPAGFTTFSNVLFNAEYDFDSGDDQSFSDEDFPKKIYLNPLFDEEIIPVKIDQHPFNVESDLIESMPNHDSSITISSKIDSLFDEFADELTLLKSIPPGIDKTDCYPEEDIHLVKRLLYDNSSPRPPEEIVSDNSNADIEFSLHLLSSIRIDDDYDSGRDILILEELLDNYSLSLPANESYHFDIPLPYRPPAKPPDEEVAEALPDVRLLRDSFDEVIKMELPKLEEHNFGRKLLSHEKILLFKARIKQWHFKTKTSDRVTKHDNLKLIKSIEERIKAGYDDDDNRDSRIKLLQEVERLDTFESFDLFQKAHEVVHEILQLDDAEGIICLPNDEIFAGLARMGYEKPSTKLTFYKAYFSSQWKFLIHTLLHSLSAKRTSWNEFSSAMASALICLSTGQWFNFLKYIFESLVRNVDSTSKFYMYPRIFANMRRVGKGFSGVKTPLFENMLKVKVVDAEEEVQVPAQDDVVQENVIEDIADDVAQPTSPLPPSPIIPSTPPHQSPSPPPQQAAEEDISVDMDEGIELVVDQEKDAEVEGRHADTQAEIYNIDLDHSSKVLSMQEDTKVQEAVEVVTTAKLITEVVTAAATQVAAASAPIPAAKPKVLKIAAAAPAVSIRRRKGVVIQDPEEELHTETLAETLTVKYKGKGILIEDPKPMKKKDQVEMDAEYNMISYLRNTEGYKMEFFKGLKYDDILPIFQARFDANLKFLFKTKEEMEKEDEEIIKSINETPTHKAAKRKRLNEQDKEDEALRKQLEVVVDEDDDVFIEATPIGRKVSVVNYEIVMINNKPRYPLSRFTLEQLVNVARLQVEEESKMSLELLRFTRQQLLEYQQG